MTRETLYIKIDKNIEAKKVDITLGDIAKLECTDQKKTAHLKTIKILAIRDKKKNRYIVSVLKIIQLIHQLYPQMEVVNIGETDFIIDYMGQKQQNKILDVLKTILVCLITFFGGAFAIMTFNSDVSVGDLFKEFYMLMTGEESNGFTILEISYSIGLPVGILVFFNHFLGKKITIDPTPIEVEMKLYEKDVNDTLIEQANRRSTTIDVD